MLHIIVLYYYCLSASLWPCCISYYLFNIIYIIWVFALCGGTKPINSFYLQKGRNFIPALREKKKCFMFYAFFLRKKIYVSLNENAQIYQKKKSLRCIMWFPLL